MTGTDLAPRADGSGTMFDQIAHRYDLLNKLISFGMDARWRRALVNALDVRGIEAPRVLDVATGTADIALAIADAHPAAKVVGLDPSVGMLDVGREKVSARALVERVELVEGDAQAMPFDDDAFDASCIAFGIRNVPDRLRGLQEMARVTRPGHRVVVLELGEPDRGPLAPFARFHVHHVIPRLGAWLSGADEYAYLQRSIAAFPPPEQFMGLMEQAGLTVAAHRPFVFGGANLYVGVVA
ncbi:MAG TPA: bifunctional demethylmenaquinone methyltransferase/2-methoxy-6-polyprenyl-1,4-benzoquinol methylase UbiE [Polyangiaceae bacterium]|nr:bifunctional demethylmenaquinone methyltransferase/2-methoxy-6-polyprenyl-1,4-benzoquinol methylase UbiE [Polyangiaceae bacterium]